MEHGPAIDPVQQELASVKAERQEYAARFKAEMQKDPAQRDVVLLQYVQGLQDKELLLLRAQAGTGAGTTGPQRVEVPMATFHRPRTWYQWLLFSLVSLSVSSCLIMSFVWPFVWGGSTKSYRTENHPVDWFGSYTTAVLQSIGIAVLVVGTMRHIPHVYNFTFDLLCQVTNDIIVASTAFVNATATAYQAFCHAPVVWTISLVFALIMAVVLCIFLVSKQNVKDAPPP